MPSTSNLRRTIMTSLTPSVIILLSLAGPSPAPLYDDKLDIMQVKDASGVTRRVETQDDWAVRRAHVLQNMQLVMGPLPGEEKRVPLDLRVEESVDAEKYTRQRISYAVEPGGRVPAYLLIPQGLDGTAPAMLCLHQTVGIGKGEPVGLGGKSNLRYAHELAERGYVCLAPDYPGFGDYLIDVYSMGYVSATMKGIWNHMRGIDLLQALPEVDDNRIGCIGHSLGGHNTLFVSVFDDRIKVAVTSCGFNRFAKYYGGNLTGWSHKGYMPRIASEYARDPVRMPFDFTEVLGALAPRHVFINAPLGDENFEVSGVKDCVESARPVYDLYDAGDRLFAVHPDCGHDFPPQERERAYQFIDKVLR
jgi:dienelactone hydrolase